MKEAEKWHQVIVANQALIDQSEDVMGLYTKAVGKPNRTAPGRGGSDRMEKVCFKCGEKGTHLFRDNLSRV